MLTIFHWIEITSKSCQISSFSEKVTVKELNLTDSSVTFCTVIVIDTSLTYLLLNAEKCHGETIWKKVFIIISTPHDAIPFVKEIFRTMFSLVSTYVVCERLSVMHEPAGVVENLVQILQFTPILQYRIPPPHENCQRSWHFNFSVAGYPPPQQIVRNLGTLTFQLQNTPPPKCQKSWHFNFSVAEYPPLENSYLGRSWYFVIFQLQNTPPPPKMKFVRNLGSLTFQLQNWC